MGGWGGEGLQSRADGGLKSALWRGLLRISDVWVQTESAGSVLQDVSVLGKAVPACLCVAV